MGENTLSENMPRIEKSPLRVKIALGYSGLEVRSTVEGIEKLPLRPCVVAVTHLSNVDMPQVALAMADRRKVGFVGYENPLSLIVGRENFFPIARYRGIKNGYDLMVEQFKRMHDGITQEGRTMVIAAHNPTQDWQLPRNPGIGAVVLAHMTNAPLVPVAVDIQSLTPVAKARDISRIKNIITNKKYKAKIYFCEPIQLPEITNKQLKLAMRVFISGEENVSEGEIKSAKETFKILENESEQMMWSIASKLPEQKRGKWNTGRTVA
ncbi:1-acyl-sn-glycerol-3-phosphate acyltransferase [Candidatus Roizmanbacteria bacterium]|nr:1-acyl-sn-glycerol-3-phosphate acyltransferase [Candidatus Roizmanbacteria bacterium]